ncbi:hypothetical protein SSX86_010884 [Deinandra increscens subsp. villosa]|uniref:SWIM-type domain-containing protein n=1 Tax=Deinandra increscens subsp. villosa TaxID=3103831 RepID=A0AAP0H3M1_9ASTR
MADDEGMFIRKAMDNAEVFKIYKDFPDRFSIKLHHGGRFTKLPNRKYVKGKVDYIDLIDIDLFSLHELDDVMLRLDYTEAGVPIFYHFKEPGKDLNNGLHTLSNDSDINHLSNFVADNKIIHVYTEHGSTNVIYFSSQHIFEEVTDDVPAHVPAHVPSQTEEQHDEQHELQNEEVVNAKCMSLDDICFEDFENGNASIVDEPMNVVGVAGTGNVETGHDDVGIADETKETSEDESDDEPMNVAGVAGTGNVETGHDDVGIADETKETSEDESDDSDFIVDDSNYMAESEVDMRDYEMFVDLDVEDNIRSDAPEGGMDDEVLDNDEFESGNESDENASSIRKQTLKYLRKTNENKANFYLGQIFGSKKEGKDLILAHAVETRRQIRFEKDDKKRVRAVCKGDLPNCGTGQSGSQVRKIRQQKKVKSKGPDQENKKGKGPNQENNKGKGPVQEKEGKGPTKNVGGRGHKTNPHIIQCPWVLLLSKEKDSETWMVKTYLSEHKCNPTRDVAALKNGFKSIGRDLLGLDGAFMKGPFPGQILSAVGIDNNNGIYPVAIAIVEAENLSSWSWFLECLGDDLELGTYSNFTFVSDRQKGILPAIAKLFPCAEHRYCLRHIHENMKGSFKGKMYKDFLWKLATTTTPVQFTTEMNELRKFNEEAYNWLSQIPPQHWSRSHFSGRAVSDVLLNNMCEVFNGKIVEGRDKPIISALEYIREYLMRRIVTVLKVIEKSEGILTPTATKMCEKARKDASRYVASWNGGDKYQVSGPRGNMRVVDLEKKVCSCRSWEITGMPCRHAVQAIWNKGDNGGDVGPLESWFHPLYKMDAWKHVYSFRLNPINGKALWSKVQVPTTLTPPTHHKQVGRPKKARKRSAVEMEDITKGGRLSKKNTTVTCVKCKNKGHNSRTCKGQGP